MTVLCSMSQDDCKNVKLIDGTYINLYDSTNVKKIQQVLIDLSASDSLVTKYEDDIIDYTNAIKGKENEIIIIESRVINKESQINEKQIQVDLLTKENNKKDKKIKLLKKTRLLYATGGVVVGILGSYYLSQIF
jgi:hypothetical protein